MIIPRFMYYLMSSAAQIIVDNVFVCVSSSGTFPLQGVALPQELSTLRISRRGQTRGVKEVYRTNLTFQTIAESYNHAITS